MEVLMTDLIKLNARFARDVELHGDNPIASSGVTWEYIQKSLKFLEEEIDETYDGFFRRDKEDTLDGALDVAVVALNLAYKLFRMSGFDHDQSVKKTEDSFKEVIDSNLSKITPCGSVFFDANGKVIKPETFKPVNLKKYFTIGN